MFDSFTSEVVELLKNGKVGVIPTDTVYGIVCCLDNQSAVEHIYDIKDRPLDKRIGTILIGDVDQIEDLVKPADLLAAEVYWPGAVSVELQMGNKLSYAHRGHQTLAFRLPDNQQLISLLKRTGPLASTSANRSDQQTAHTLEEAMGVFRESVDFYVNGGDLSHHKASRIIKINENGTITEIRS